MRICENKTRREGERRLHFLKATDRETEKRKEEATDRETENRLKKEGHQSPPGRKEKVEDEDKGKQLWSFLFELRNWGNGGAVTCGFVKDLRRFWGRWLAVEEE